MQSKQTTTPRRSVSRYANVQFRRELRALTARDLTWASTIDDYCCIIEEIENEGDRLTAKAETAPEADAA
jgi:hypothetical protein